MLLVIGRLREKGNRLDVNEIAVDLVAVFAYERIVALSAARLLPACRTQPERRVQRTIQLARARCTPLAVFASRWLLLNDFHSFFCCYYFVF